jgi:hypothetical protein
MRKKRTFIAILPAAGQQLLGAAFVLGKSGFGSKLLIFLPNWLTANQGYVTYFLSLIGVTKYFTVSVVLYVVMLLSSLSGFYFVEAAGRRILLVRQTTLFYKFQKPF